jgi:steroid delta-isomerase-like uncharacterized protein
MSAAAPSTAEKALARRLMEEAWSQGHLSAVDEIVAANFTNRDPSTPDFGRGPEAYKQVIGLYRNAFPDAQFEIDDIVAEGNKVALRYTCRATHRGELIGIPPTGKQVTVTGMLVFRIAGGKIEEGWVNWDTLGLLQQLGAIPALGS